MRHSILKIFIIDHIMLTMTVKPYKLYLSISRSSTYLSPFYLTFYCCLIPGNFYFMMCMIKQMPF